MVNKSKLYNQKNLIWWKYLSLIIISVLLLPACKSTQLNSPNSAQSDLEDRIRFLAICLNKRDAACLEKIYAADFKSISPVIDINSTQELISTTIKNYTANQLTVQVEIEELSAGPQQGYAIVNWTILQRQADGQQEIFLQQQRMEIWQRNATQGWQLRRTLFYNPVRR